jgi:hypothetical protein
MKAGQRTLALYLLVAAAYITLGVFVPRFLLSWVEGAGALLLGVWLVPALLRRRR